MSCDDLSQLDLPGPVPPRTDLRSMLRHHVMRRCVAALRAGEQRRLRATEEHAWAGLRDFVRARVADQIGPLAFGPMKTRLVSSHPRPGYLLENVLLESLGDWEVNASVYLPVDAPAPWPAIVVPVGHSGKQFENYQHPAQVFARCGYAAVTFDPPGQAGEKQPGNDHFHDGVRCYLTGETANRYFVADAIRCVDYMISRPDVDSSHGVAMTGVSGGGHTTIFATLLDERIAVAGPVCCAVPLIEHPVLDAYAACPEGLPIGRIGDGIGEVDMLCAAMPTPIMLAAGKGDEVFFIEWGRELARQTAAAYGSEGHAERFRFYEAQGGHAYSVATALEFVRWANRWMLGEPDRPTPAVSRADLEMLRHEMVRCYPGAEPNMFTFTRDHARTLKRDRECDDLRRAVREVVNAPDEVAVPDSEEGTPHRIWMVMCQEIMLRPEAGIELPGTFLYDVDCPAPLPAVLYLDDRHRWADLRRSGMMARACRFIDRDKAPGPAVLSVDLRGWGDSAPAPVPYDMAGWSGIDRSICYMSACLGDHVLAQRVRDAACALAWLAARPQVDADNIALMGRGLGGVVALMAATLTGRARSVVTLDMLASFQELTETGPYAWSQEAFMSGVLTRFDLPELAGALACRVVLVNPMDGTKAVLSEERASEVYAEGQGRNGRLEVITALPEGQAEQAVIAALGGQ